MDLPRKTEAERLAQERDVLKRLNACYRTPGVERDLLKAENEAFQAVIRVLERRTKRRSLTLVPIIRADSARRGHRQLRTPNTAKDVGGGAKEDR